MRKIGRITAGLVMAVMLMTACSKNTGTVAETSGENLVSTEAQGTETTAGADVKETTTAKETTKSSTKETTGASKTDGTTTAAKKNTETTTAQETTSAKAVVTETTTAQETTSARAVVTETTTQAQETTTAQPETTTQARTEASTTQPETTTEAQTEAPATQPETTTQAPTEAPTQAPTEAPTTQPETTTEAPTEAGPKSDEELLAEISDPHYGTRAEVNGNVYWYSGGWQRSHGAWNGPSLNSIMGNVRDGMEVYATENSVLNNMNEQAAQYSWSTTGEDLGWYDEGYVSHEWTYCDERPCEWHNH